MLGCFRFMLCSLYLSVALFIVACGSSKDEPAPILLQGKWKLDRQDSGVISTDASGNLVSHTKYMRSGDFDEYLIIGDSTWVYDRDIYNGGKNGVYAYRDTTVTVKRPSPFSIPMTDIYGISNLNSHSVVIRTKFTYPRSGSINPGYTTNYTKWTYTR